MDSKFRTGSPPQAAPAEHPERRLPERVADWVAVAGLEEVRTAFVSPFAQAAPADSVDTAAANPDLARSPVVPGTQPALQTEIARPAHPEPTAQRQSQ